MSGVARRAWARNEGALEVSAGFNARNAKQTGEHITLPYVADEAFLADLVKAKR
jgi:urocanate hydratase